MEILAGLIDIISLSLNVQIFGMWLLFYGRVKRRGGIVFKIDFD